MHEWNILPVWKIQFFGPQYAPLCSWYIRMLWGLQLILEALEIEFPSSSKCLLILNMSLQEKNEHNNSPCYIYSFKFDPENSTKVTIFVKKLRTFFIAYDGTYALVLTQCSLTNPEMIMNPFKYFTFFLHPSTVGLKKEPRHY